MMPIDGVRAGWGEREHNVHAGEEFVHVIEGALMIELAGEERIILREGDSAYYQADRPHLFATSPRVRRD